jgi:hypothetical protein
MENTPLNIDMFARLQVVISMGEKTPFRGRKAGKHTTEH